MRLPTHPDGEIKTYRDALDREQTSVDGPSGHVLITRHNRFEPYQVWHSDQLDTIARTSDHRHAIRTACIAAGLDLSRLRENDTNASAAGGGPGLAQSSHASVR